MTQPSIEEVLAQATPRTVTVRVCLRGDLLGRHQQLEVQLLEAARLDGTEIRHAEAPAVARHIQELEAEIEASKVEFTFQSLGRKGWTDLLAKHLPGEQDRADGCNFNRETFPIAALAASCITPVMTVPQTERLAEAVNDGQWQLLWDACLAANMEGSDPFSLAASVVLHGSETKSEEPGTTESPAASS